MLDGITEQDLLDLERDLITSIDKMCSDEVVALELSRMVSEKLQFMRGVILLEELRSV